MTTVREYYEEAKSKSFNQNKEEGRFLAIWGIDPDDRFLISFDIKGDNKIEIGPVTLARIFNALKETPEKNIIIAGPDFPVIDISKIVWIEKI